jgi:hypothetical protein
MHATAARPLSKCTAINRAGANLPGSGPGRQDCSSVSKSACRSALAASRVRFTVLTEQLRFDVAGVAL